MTVVIAAISLPVLLRRMDGRRVSPADCGRPFGVAAWLCWRCSHTGRKVVRQDAYCRATCSKRTLPPGSRHARKQPRLGADKALVAPQGIKAPAHRRMAGCATVVGCRAFRYRPNIRAWTIHLYWFGHARQEARSFRDGSLLLFDHVSHDPARIGRVYLRGIAVQPLWNTIGYRRRCEGRHRDYCRAGLPRWVA